jgi:hypothetical protein
VAFKRSAREERAQATREGMSWSYHGTDNLGMCGELSQRAERRPGEWREAKVTLQQGAGEAWVREA